MARTFHRRDRLSAISEINIMPLLDLAFALLIIFMITAPLLEQSIDLNLPFEDQKLQSSTEKKRILTISINNEGLYFWDDREVDKAKLTELLEDISAQLDKPVISIRADREIPYQKVITVIDLVKQNNLTKISLDTQIK